MLVETALLLAREQECQNTQTTDLEQSSQTPSSGEGTKDNGNQWLRRRSTEKKGKKKRRNTMKGDRKDRKMELSGGQECQ